MKTPTTITIELTDPKLDQQIADFTQNVVLNQDVFRASCCGYWLLGAYWFDASDFPNHPDHPLIHTWLAIDHEVAGKPSEGSIEEMVRSFTIDMRDPSPRCVAKPWFLLTPDVARRAFVEGIKLGGVNWYERADGNDYDVAIQMALFGEVRYG